MSANPIDKNSTPKPTGSLEDLFRHHLGEEAAAPPRPMLWDQIDNSLLVRQNETYRRRLAATRWVAAASLLLATLAGTGWWAHRSSDMAGTEVATRATGSGSSPAAGQAATRRSSSSQGPTSVASTGYGTGSTAASTTDNADPNEAALARNAPATVQLGKAVGSSRSQTGFGPASVRAGLDNGSVASSATQGGVASGVDAPSAISSSASSLETVAQNQVALATTAAPVAGSSALGPDGSSPPVEVASGATATGTAPTATNIFGGTTAAGSPAMAAFAQASPAALPGQIGMLTPAPAALALNAPAALPNGLAALAVPAEAEPVVAAATRKWHYGGSYTAGTFNPNINFSREGLGSEYAYNPALGADSPALTEAAASQYRDNLRPGLTQRIALVAKRHLTGNWSLNTGAEFSQATAKSASTSAFVGEQLLDLGQFSTGAMRTTSFRYRTAGIPVSLSYNNAEKRGWSFYGRLSGVVSALLGVRSEVEGSPEATRTYSIASAGTPYRRVLGSIRGAAGAQYRSAVGDWAFTLAPVAELGLVPLNAHPAQSYFAQSRPYSFGLEAAVEFGR